MKYSSLDVLNKNEKLDDFKIALVQISMKRLDHFIKTKNLKKARRELDILTRRIVEAVL